MQLTCDCYGGCWGDHSKDWPSIPVGDWTALAVNEAGIPVGYFVFVGDRIRVENEKLLKLLRFGNQSEK